MLRSMLVWRPLLVLMGNMLLLLKGLVMSRIRILLSREWLLAMGVSAGFVRLVL
jgi:hypothetical protein